MKEETLNQLWEYMKQVSTTYIYCELLIDEQNEREKSVRLLVMILMAAAVYLSMGTEWAAAFAGAVGYLATGLKAFRQLYLRDEENLRSLRKTATDLRICFRKAQGMFDRLRCGKMDDTEVHSRYIELAKLYEPRMTEASVAIGKLDRGINQRAADNSDRYLTSLYY